MNRQFSHFSLKQRGAILTRFLGLLGMYCVMLEPTAAHTNRRSSLQTLSMIGLNLIFWTLQVFSLFDYYWVSHVRLSQV